MNDKPQEEKKPARDYTPFSVNYRELFTLITGTMARNIHKELHRIFDSLLGHHVSCDDFSKAWYVTHLSVAKQFPEITTWIKNEMGIPQGDDFSETSSRDKELGAAQINVIIERGREKFGETFQVTPVDAPKGKELRELALGFFAAILDERIKDMERGGSPNKSIEIDLGNGISGTVVEMPKDVAEALDQMMGQHRGRHGKGKKDYWPN